MSRYDPAILDELLAMPSADPAAEPEDDEASMSGAATAKALETLNTRAADTSHAVSLMEDKLDAFMTASDRRLAELTKRLDNQPNVLETLKTIQEEHAKIVLILSKSVRTPTPESLQGSPRPDERGTNRASTSPEVGLPLPPTSGSYHRAMSAKDVLAQLENFMAIRIAIRWLSIRPTICVVHSGLTRHSGS